MILYSESAIEINDKQNALFLDIAAHDIYSMTDMYVESCYMEDASEKEDQSDEKKSILKTISNKLRGLIDKIRDIIDGFKASVESKKNLTAEEFLSSETATVQMEYDIVAMQKEVDQEYLEARKIVSKISGITKVPIDEVAAFCDKMDAKLHENKDKFVPVGKAIVKTTAIDKVRKGVYNNIADSKKLTDDINNYLDEFDKVAYGKPLRDISPDDIQKNANAVTRLSVTLGKMIGSWKGVYRKIDKAAARISGVARKEYARALKK